MWRRELDQWARAIHAHGGWLFGFWLFDFFIFSVYFFPAKGCSLSAAEQVSRAINAMAGQHKFGQLW